jgi:ATP-dependent Clp protease adapter protein ClpS
MLSKLPCLWIAAAWAALAMMVNNWNGGTSGVSAFSIPRPLALHRYGTVRTVGALAAGPATLEPPVKEKVEEVVKDEDRTQEASKIKRGGWAVRLWNDPVNKREFVSMCLCKIVGLTDGQAYQVMMEAHKNGLSVIGRFDLERAELYRDKLRENGLTVDMIPVEDD